MSTAKTAVAAAPQVNGYDQASYFPQQQQTYQPDAIDAETLPGPFAQSPSDYGNSLAAPVAIRPARFTEEWDASQRGSSVADGPASGVNQRPASYSGLAGGIPGDAPASLTRGNTLRKKASLRRSGSLKRSGSRRSMKAGSVRSLALQSTTDKDQMHSAFYCPIPTATNPTEILANRFQAWRKILKDLITFFKEIQTHYEHRAKSLLKLATVLNNTATPPGLFLASGGLDDALRILRGYSKQAISEANKAREIEEDVILALTGLRSDLHQKIKEIKNLSGDFKNSVEKEMDNTRKAVTQLQEVLGQTELDPSLTTGKQDPYLLRLAVDRQLERQIDEENYLHQAYLNLENSGRELESIVVGEIQKAYNAYAGILKRESDAAYNTIEELRTGPISMPKDKEWMTFIQRDDRFVDPDLPMRSSETIHYPGRDHPACQEVRAGLLERKSKYLKSYTPGWYVLSPTHLHEYKSADKTQAPVMSLYLPEQKLGSHSDEGSSSNKFVLKGRQTGPMHRGHTWVFRAESHDTMMAWYDDIKILTERTPEERSNLMRGNSRSISRSSQRSSISSDGVGDEEEPPFTATGVPVNEQPKLDALSRRPSGGRFPSDLQVNAQRGLHAPVSPLSVSSGYGEGFNHDYFPATVSPGNDLGQSPRGFHEFVHERETETDGFPRQKAMDGPPGSRFDSPAAVPLPHTPNSQEPRQADASVFDTRATEDPNRAGPGPIPFASPKYSQEPPSTRDTARGGVYGSQVTATATGGHTPALTQNPAPDDGEQAPPGMANDAVEDEQARRPRVVARGDSVPTVSNLHIPGEYPRGSVAGL